MATTMDLSMRFKRTMKQDEAPVPVPDLVFISERQCTTRHHALRLEARANDNHSFLYSSPPPHQEGEGEGDANPFAHLNAPLDGSTLVQAPEIRSPFGPDYPYLAMRYPDMRGLRYRFYNSVEEAVAEEFEGEYDASGENGDGGEDDDGASSSSSVVYLYTKERGAVEPREDVASSNSTGFLDSSPLEILSGTSSPSPRGSSIATVAPRGDYSPERSSYHESPTQDGPAFSPALIQWEGRVLLTVAALATLPRSPNFGPRSWESCDPSSSETASSDMTPSPTPTSTGSGYGSGSEASEPATQYTSSESTSSCSEPACQQPRRGRKWKYPFHAFCPGLLEQPSASPAPPGFRKDYFTGRAMKLRATDNVNARVWLRKRYDQIVAKPVEERAWGYWEEGDSEMDLTEWETANRRPKRMRRRERKAREVRGEQA